MKRLTFCLVGAVAVILAINAAATIHYVDVNSANPASPYTGWTTAATNIQDAVNSAATGDTVLVTNGLYQLGGANSSRVAVTNAITVASVNGAATTVINGAAAVTCVRLASGSILNGFTVTNGAASTGAGVVGPANSNAVVSDCVITGNKAGTAAGAYQCILTNCFISGNSVTQYSGGGAGSCILVSCVLSNNSAMGGGGAIQCDLRNCLIVSNTAVSSGGGAAVCKLNDCTVVGNVASVGGGVEDCISLSNCTVQANSAGFGGGAANIQSGLIAVNSTFIDNIATNTGGGAYAGPTLICLWTNCVFMGNTAGNGGGTSLGSLYNCVLAGNVATTNGGGCNKGVLRNCVIAGNTAAGQGGGAFNSTSCRNSIIYFNTAPDGSNYSGGIFSSSCTTPLPGSGTGNFTNAPLFVDLAAQNFRLQTNSPCINAGSNANAPGGVDLDGNPRISGGTVDVGAYEFQSPASIMSYVWAQQFGLATDGSADYADTDGDGLNNYSEWMAGTVPTDPASVLALFSPATNAVGLTVTWQSVATKTYFLQRATNLTDSAAFSTLKSNIAGQTGTTSYADNSATNSGPYFYRVGVQ